MTVVLLCLAVTGCVLAAGSAALAAGIRAGDRVGDSIVVAVEPDSCGRFVQFALHNPGDQAVLMGASVRRRSLRMRLEAGSFVQVPRRTGRGKLMAAGHALICAIDARASETVRVPVSQRDLKRAELVVAIGEADRLRVIHRAIEMPGPRRATAADRLARALA